MTSSNLDTGLPPAAIEALQLAKSAFLWAQSGRCGYLRVAFEPRPETGELAVAANFPLRPKREWHHASASIKLSELKGPDPQPAVRRAFADLTESVDTTNIAHLFRPYSTAAE